MPAPAPRRPRPRQPRALRALGWLWALSAGLAGCGRPAQDPRAAALLAEGRAALEEHLRAPDGDTLRRGLARLEEGLALAPDDAVGRYWRGRALEELGEVERAAEDYAVAVDRDPEDGAAHARLGALLLGEGRAEEARAALARALELGQDDARVHVDLGQALEDLERPGDARAQYAAALERQPALDDAHFRLSQLLRAEGDEEGAERELAAFYHYNGLEMGLAKAREALRADRGDVEAWFTRARSAWQLGRLDEASAALDELARLAPEDPQTWIGRAMLARERGDEARSRAEGDQALGLLERRAAAAPTDPGPRHARALAALELGRLDVALADFDRTLALDDGNLDARLGRAQALVESERVDDAAAEYRAVLDRDPANEAALQSLQYLMTLGGDQ